MTTDDNFKKRRSTTILIELTRRIYDQCIEQGREDLANGVWLLEKLALANPEAVRNSRAELLDVLKQDDWIIETAEYITTINNAVAEGKLVRLH
ncbi:hypothetical protein BJ122_10595 [Rhodopseudomonas faecalis]|uniref:Uncharacterized protein n=1 Tax=Rhodopseudomonas faecalis TaxID=99655 RepID=A0A318TL48_9BRAD|nr:hypothetical protein [Rhodopseudomonas faecalis]PYF03838.1 hypothetical protein BJ122_10595 [Rhodopseudomonas faecalis]